MKEPWYAWIANRLFGSYISARVQQSVRVIDDDYWRDAGRRTEDRSAHLRFKDLEEALDAWRNNALCRRLVSIKSDYIVGDGLTVSSPSPVVDRFISSFWHHPQNKMDGRLCDWCDELTRAGELFVVLSRNPADGMSYVRLIPASWIDQVETDPDDFEREVRYHEKPRDVADAGTWWPAAAVAGPEVDQVMLHFAINRPAGCVRGESDLLPVLEWLGHYSRWLEDRVRVNRLKSAFVWFVKLVGATPDLIKLKQAQYGRPPSPGSVIVANENEEWSAVQPKIDAEEVEADGKAIRLMIAAGMGVPLHFLSEGESATRATAAEMGDPTYRHFRQRQRDFMDMVREVVVTAYDRAVLVGRQRRMSSVDVRIEVPEIVSSDNESLGRALRMTAEALATMHRHAWVDDSTAARLAFKAAGESVSEKRLSEILEQARKEVEDERRSEIERERGAAGGGRA